MKIPNEPLGATPKWRAAALAAGLTCRCRRGECGKTHSATGGVCDQRLAEYSGVRLHLVTDAAHGEVVVCSDCFDGRRTIANRAARKAADARREAYALFDIPAD